jgi:hypothetical protein
MGEVVDFLDLAEAPETVSIGKQEVAVHGVSARGFLLLYRRFPEVAGLFGGAKTSIDLDDVMTLGADAVSAIGAAGLGYPGDAKAEARFDRMAADAQRRTIKAIISVTMPDGPGPFFEDVMALFKGVEQASEKIEAFSGIPPEVMEAAAKASDKASQEASTAS